MVASARSSRSRARASRSAASRTGRTRSSTSRSRSENWRSLRPSPATTISRRSARTPTVIAYSTPDGWSKSPYSSLWDKRRGQRPRTNATPGAFGQHATTAADDPPRRPRLPRMHRAARHRQGSPHVARRRWQARRDPTSTHPLAQAQRGPTAPGVQLGHRTGSNSARANPRAASTSESASQGMTSRVTIHPRSARGQPWAGDDSALTSAITQMQQSQPGLWGSATFLLTDRTGHAGGLLGASLCVRESPARRRLQGSENGSESILVPRCSS